MCKFPKEWTEEAQIEPLIVAHQAIAGSSCRRLNAIDSLPKRSRQMASARCTGLSDTRPQCTRRLGPVTGFCEDLESF